MAAIDVNDVAVAIGRPISETDEVNQVEQWIDDVNLILTARIGDLSVVNHDLLRYVEREAVVSRMRSRQDQDAEVALDSSYFLGVLAPWWALLQVAPPRNVSAFSVMPC